MRVQRILRHSNIKLTVDTYGHLVVEDLRDAVDTLPKLEALAVRQACMGSHQLPSGATPFVPPMSPADGDSKKTKPPDR